MKNIKTTRVWGWAALGMGLLIFFSLAFRLDRLPLFEPDEARYAEVSREMNETGQFLIPQLNYQPRITKPALFHWMIAGSQRVIPSFVAASRAPSVLAGAVLMTILSLFVWRYFPTRRSTPVVLTLLGSLSLFWIMARMAMVDLCLTTCITTSLLLLFGWEQQRDRRILFWMAGGAIALGFNFKGPLAYAAPLVVFWIYAAWRGQAVSIWRMLPWGRWLILTVALSLPWFVAVIWKEGHSASQFFLGNEVIGRLVGRGENRAQGFFYYIGIIPVILLPWTGLFIRGLWQTKHEIQKEGRHAWAQAHPLEAFLVVWVLAIPVFLSFVSAKMIQYILPIIPGVALYVALKLNREETKPQFPLKFPAVGFGVLVTGVFLLFAALETGTVKGIPILAAFGALLLILTFLVSFSARWRILPAIIGSAVIALACYQGLQATLSGMNTVWNSQRAWGQLALPYVRPGVQLLTHGQIPSSVLTEVKTPILQTDPWFSIAAFADHQPVMLLGRRAEISHFRKILSLPPYDEMHIEVFTLEAGDGKHAFAFNRAYIEKFHPKL